MFPSLRSAIFTVRFEGSISGPVAGASLSSLWPVSDLPTYSVSRHFFRCRSGRPFHHLPHHCRGLLRKHLALDGGLDFLDHLAFRIGDFADQKWLYQVASVNHRHHCGNRL